MAPACRERSCKQASHCVPLLPLRCLGKLQGRRDAHPLTSYASYDQGVLGGLIALPNFLESNRMDPEDADEQGTIVAIYDVGCFTGCLIMAFIGQKLGRRMYIFIGGLLIILGGSLQAGANGTAYLYAGRIIGGVGMGRYRRVHHPLLLLIAVQGSTQPWFRSGLQKHPKLAAEAL